MTTKQKLNTIKGRYDRTRLKGKKTLVTTLVNTPNKQMRIIEILAANCGLKVTSVKYGQHQLVTVIRK